MKDMIFIMMLLNQYIIQGSWYEVGTLSQYISIL